MESKFLDQDVDVVSLANKGILEPPNCDTISTWLCSIMLIVVLMDVF